MKKTDTKELAKVFFKDEEGKELILTPKQVEIFDLIWKRKNKRNHLMCYTRYGKSFVVALATLLRVATFPEKWAIVAPSEKKAKIIMSYIIEHVFDNDYTKQKLEIDKNESMDRLRRERSKNRLTFKHTDGTLGEVFILSADSRNRQNAGDALMGFGAPNVILDEAALIDDDIEAKIFRMLGDKPDNFYLKIGNPFRRNHFLKSWKDPRYSKINVDYEIGIKEGRATKDFIDEAMDKPHFDILFENTFPAADMVDDKGWSFLITDSEFDKALKPYKEEEVFGERLMGVDIARGGGNYNVWVLRNANHARVLAKNRDGDLMSVVGTTIRLAQENNISMENIFLDDTGVGAGVSDRIREQRYNVKAVTLGASAREYEKYKNVRAECYWKLRNWLIEGNSIDKDDNWQELTYIKYKADSAGKLQIMSKEEMKRYGIESPDVADALMLTFAKKYKRIGEEIQQFTPNYKSMYYN